MKRLGWLLLLAGCSSAPPATPALSPSVLVQPGNAKSFDAFRSDDAECRRDATTQAGNVNDARLLQHRYDFAYQRCMLARGNKIPVAVRPEEPGRVARRPPPPPPPPPGMN